MECLAHQSWVGAVGRRAQASCSRHMGTLCSRGCASVLKRPGAPQVRCLRATDSTDMRT